MNTTYNADIVISQLVGTKSTVWYNDEPIANVEAMGRDLIAAGAAARKMSVYDVAAGHFLSGTVAQLMEGEEVGEPTNWVVFNASKNPPTDGVIFIPIEED